MGSGGIQHERVVARPAEFLNSPPFLHDCRNIDDLVGIIWSSPKALGKHVGDFLPRHAALFAGRHMITLAPEAGLEQKEQQSLRYPIDRNYVVS